MRVSPLSTSTKLKQAAVSLKLSLGSCHILVADVEEIDFFLTITVHGNKQLPSWRYLLVYIETFITGQPQEGQSCPVSPLCFVPLATRLTIIWHSHSQNVWNYIEQKPKLLLLQERSKVRPLSMSWLHAGASGGWQMMTRGGREQPENWKEPFSFGLCICNDTPERPKVTGQGLLLTDSMLI